MGRYLFGHRDDEPDAESGPGSAHELIPTVAWLYTRQTKLEEKLTRVDEAIKLLSEAQRIASLSGDDLRVLALSAARPRPFTDSLSYRYGRLVGLVIKAQRVLEDTD